MRDGSEEGKSFHPIVEYCCGEELKNRVLHIIVVEPTQDFFDEYERKE